MFATLLVHLHLLINKHQAIFFASCVEWHVHLLWSSYRDWLGACLMQSKLEISHSIFPTLDMLSKLIWMLEISFQIALADIKDFLSHSPLQKDWKIEAVGVQDQSLFSSTFSAEMNCCWNLKSAGKVSLVRLDNMASFLHMVSVRWLSHMWGSLFFSNPIFRVMTQPPSFGIIWHHNVPHQRGLLM